MMILYVICSSYHPHQNRPPPLQIFSYLTPARAAKREIGLPREKGMVEFEGKTKVTDLWSKIRLQMYHVGAHLSSKYLDGTVKGDCCCLLSSN